MLGSKNNFFRQLPLKLIRLREDVECILSLKGYNFREISIYLKAYDYFCINVNDFDGATIVKDLCDIPNLDLDAMLHDYHYLAYNAGANFKTKFQADWIYAKGQERKGKSQLSSFSRFIGLTAISIGFVPFANIKRGKANKISMLTDYKTLINKK